jgi:hypothetical protein
MNDPVHQARREATDQVRDRFLQGDQGQLLSGAFPARMEEAVAFMHHSCAVQMERIQAQLDGVTLAAEQVQDKRIELLERGPEVSGTAVFIEFALTLVLETPLAGRLLHLVTRRIMTPIVRRRLAVPLQTAQDRLRSVALRHRRPGAVIGPTLSVKASYEAKQLADELKKLHDSFKDAGKSSSEYLVGAIKATRAARQTAGEAQPPSDPSDTPGVALLSLQQGYASHHRLQLGIDVANYEFWLRAGLISVDDIYNIFAWEELDVSLEEIRDRSKRYFEVLVWSVLLWQQAKNYKQGLTKKSLTAPEQVFGNLTDHAPGSLISYWLYRFTDPKTNKPFAQAAALKADGKTYDTSVASLARYMQELARSANANKATLVTSGPLVAS